MNCHPTTYWSSQRSLNTKTKKRGRSRRRIVRAKKIRKSSATGMRRNMSPLAAYMRLLSLMFYLDEKKRGRSRKRIVRAKKIRKSSATGMRRNTSAPATCIRLLSLMFHLDETHSEISSHTRPFWIHVTFVFHREVELPK